MSLQGLLVAILYCFVNKEVSLSASPLFSRVHSPSTKHSSLPRQVQSEILKKWKRWKLGRNIEEEYRHTYSNTNNTKTGSLLNHVARLPHLPDIAKSSAPICSPEERHMLVAGCYNGAVHDKDPERSVDGTISSCTLVEDMDIADKMRVYDCEKENVESNL